MFQFCGCWAISIHALREEGDARAGAFSSRASISIHALREEGDPFCKRFYLCLTNFYPRPPRGGRLLHGCNEGRINHFYPRPPRGGRPAIHPSRNPHQKNFYPRPPRGGRRQGLYHIGMLREISIHALREEGDFAGRSGHPAQFRFLSTPSARRATAKTETKSLFSNKLYNILHEFRRALIYNGSKSYPNHAK